MSKQPNEPKKPAGKDDSAEGFFRNFVPPPGFVFPGIPGFPEVPGFEQLLKMKPLPGKEEEYACALETIRSVMETDFGQPIDLENVCGHRAPGVEMKEGYCPTCFEDQQIGTLLQLLDLADKFGPEKAAQMMKPPSTSGGASSSSSGARPNTSGQSSSSAPNAPSVPSASDTKNTKNGEKNNGKSKKAEKD